MNREETNPNINQTPEQNSEREKIEKLKDNLVGYYLSSISRKGGDMGYISEPDNPEFSPSQFPEGKEMVVEMMANDKDFGEAERILLEHIERPDQNKGVDGVFEDLAGSEEQKAILSYMSDREREGFKKESLSGKYIGKLLEKYPTPMDFNQDSKEFLESIEKICADRGEDETFGKYEDAMESFKKNIYGEAYDYYKAMQEMHSEAEKVKKAEENSKETGQMVLEAFEKSDS